MYSECSFLYKPMEQANAGILHKNLGQGCILYDRHPVNIVGRDESLCILQQLSVTESLKKRAYYSVEPP